MHCLVMCHTAHGTLNLVPIPSQPWHRPVWWTITALIFQSLMESCWLSLLAFQAMGERLDMVGFWALSKPLFHACLPASCSWTAQSLLCVLLTVLIYLKTQHPDSQNPKLPLWVRRVILIQSHLAHPSVWPWNPDICSWLLLGFVRWQAKTLMGNLGQLSCTVMCVCTHTRVHMCLWLTSRAKERPSAGSGHSLCYGGRRWKQQWPEKMLRALVPSQATGLTDLRPQIQLFPGVVVYRVTVRLQKTLKVRISVLFHSYLRITFSKWTWNLLYTKESGVEMNSLSRWLIEFASYWR